MITEDQKKQYEAEGYLIFEDLFSTQEMDELTERIDKFDEASERELQQKGQQFGRIPNQINFTAQLNLKDPEIQRFIADDRFVAIATDLVGPDIKLYYDQSVYKRPEAARDFPWHQDNGYAATDPVHYLTCWLALNDSTIENGCVWIKPRTHLLGLVEHTKTDIGWQCYFGEDGTPVPLKKGSMVAFHSLLFHRSTPNRSQTTRKGYVVQYGQVGMKHAATGRIFDNGPVIALAGKPVYHRSAGN